MPMGYNTLHSENGIREKSESERIGNRGWTNLIYLFTNVSTKKRETLYTSLTVSVTVDPNRPAQSS